jgi:predicted PurR-regulated permease PerM
MARFLEQSGRALRQWLGIQCYVVGMNAAMAGLGLSLLGIDAPIALATLGGALSFVPYFGSLIALAVGALVALPQGVGNAALAAAVSGGASFI